MTQNYTDIVEALYTKLNDAGLNATIGFLPPLGGVAITYTGGESETDMAGHSYLTLRFTLNAKAQTEYECVAMLDKAHSALQRIDIDDEDEDWHIYGCRIISAPSVAAEDAQHMWIVTSGIRVKCLSLRGA